MKDHRNGGGLMKIRNGRLVHAGATLFTIAIGLFAVLITTAWETLDYETTMPLSSGGLTTAVVWTSYADFSAWYDEALDAYVGESEDPRDFIATFRSYDAEFFDGHALVYLPVRGEIDDADVMTRFGILRIRLVYVRQTIPYMPTLFLPLLFIVDNPGTIESVSVRERWIEPQVEFPA